MKKYGLLIVFLLPLTTISAQGISVRFETSYSMYSMTSLQAWQEDFIASTELPLQVVDDFPSYYGYELSVAGQSNRNEYGIFFGYNSTGGRIDLQDYSGSLRNDQLLNSMSYGVFYHYQINHSDLWRIYASLHLSTVISKMDIKYSVQVLDQEPYTYTEEMHATSYGFRPGLYLRRELGTFALYTAVNYEVQTKGDIHYNRNNNKLTESDGTRVYTQWGGLRLSVGVGITLGKHE